MNLKSKCKNFHTQIRKEKLNDLFESKRKQIFSNYTDFNTPLTTLEKDQPSLNSEQNSIDQSSKIIQTNLQQQLQVVTEHTDSLFQAVQTDNIVVIQELLCQISFKVDDLFRVFKNVGQVEKICNYWQALQLPRHFASSLSLLSENISNSERIEKVWQTTVKFLYALIHRLPRQLKEEERIPYYEIMYLLLGWLEGRSHTLKSLLKKQFVLIIELFQKCPEARVDICFLNHRTSSKWISLENICFVLYKHRNIIEEPKFSSIKMMFLGVCCQMLEEAEKIFLHQEFLQQFPQNIQQVSQIQNISPACAKVLKVLKTHNKLQLDDLIKSQTIVTVSFFLKQMLNYYLQCWPQNPQNQQDLEQCVVISRLFLELYPNLNYKQLQMQASQLLSLMSYPQINQSLKREILAYIDLLVYLSEGPLLKRLVREQDLLRNVWWGVDKYPVLTFNIINNLLLQQLCFGDVLKMINQIVIFFSNNLIFSDGNSQQSIFQHKFVENYFLGRDFLVQDDKDFLVLNLLFQNQGMARTQELLDRQKILFYRLREKGYQGPLPRQSYFSLQKEHENGNFQFDDQFQQKF